ncbi:MAG: MFS transporter, partial [Gemmatimonadetes bacterium]|nr:MFS transporter [Gemmatimonadota bacterium]
MTRDDLRLVSGEGVAFSLMVGAGESYLAAFVLALGLGEVASGLISTVPLLAGGVIQLATPAGIRLVGSRRRWSVACAIAQALAFVPLGVGAWLGRIPAVAVFASAALYWAAGMAIGPAWNAWVELLVPRAVRRRYFARRTSAVQLGLLGSLLGAGFVLQRAEGLGAPLLGFVVLFAVAGAARLLSAGLLARTREPEQAPVEEGGLPALPLLRRFPTGAGGRLLVYMLALTGVVMISGPFFSAYYLAELGLSYPRYVVLIGTALAAKVVMLPLLDAPARKFGLVPLLRVAWIGIAAVPLLYLVSRNFWFMAGIQLLSGAAWAAHEYTTFLLLFETIHARRRVAILTAYNLGNAVVTIAGSLLGGTLFDSIEGGSTGYVTLFACSGAGRVACYFLLRLIPPVSAPVRRVAFRAVAVRPTMGAVLR